MPSRSSDELHVPSVIGPNPFALNASPAGGVELIEPLHYGTIGTATAHTIADAAIATVFTYHGEGLLYLISFEPSSG